MIKMSIFRKQNKPKLSETEQICKKLTELVNKRIEQNYNHMGIRSETEGMNCNQKSKAIRAYIVDLFGNYPSCKGLHELEDAVGKSLDLYYMEEDQCRLMRYYYSQFNDDCFNVDYDTESNVLTIREIDGCDSVQLTIRDDQIYNISEGKYEIEV